MSGTLWRCGQGGWLALLLTACASVPVSGSLPSRQGLRDFEVAGRFSLRVQTPGEAGRSASGRLSWLHRQQRDHVLLASPLGQGVAELVLGERAELILADGQRRVADDADALLAAATGYALPVSRLADWLLGEPGPDGRLTRDAQGRPLRLLAAGWQIDYAYADEDADALPIRLLIERAGELELRLRLETWNALP